MSAILPGEYVTDAVAARLSDVTTEELFEILKRYDTPKDYTYYKSDDELREGCVYLVEQSRLIREQCIKYGLPYFETSRNREQIIDDF
jgi:hypothetical protein